jgi:hypothetical protein
MSAITETPIVNGAITVKVRFVSQHTAYLFEQYQKAGRYDMMNKQFRRGKAQAEGQRFFKILPGVKYHFIMTR